MITSLNHIGFEVPNWAEARQFFVDALGFRQLQPEELRANPSLAFFTWPELNHGSATLVCLEHASGLRIILADQSGIDEILRPSERKQPAGWHYHLALNVANLAATKDALSKYPGVRIHSTSTVPPYTTIITPWGMYIMLVEKPSPDLLAQQVSSR